MMAVYLSENIRAYSFRQILKNKSIVIPYELPSHLLLCGGSNNDSGCRKKTKIYGKFSSPFRPLSMSEELKMLRRDLLAGSLESSTMFPSLHEKVEDLSSSLLFDDVSVTTLQQGSFLCVYTPEEKP